MPHNDDLDEFFVSRNGRRMSALCDTYPLPVDADEVKRSELHHRMMQFVFSGRNYVGPVKEALQFGQQRRILDLGTGSGQWAIDMADEFPRAEVIGIDIAPIQPKLVPPNCTFETCDLEDAFLPYPSASFDLIHARGVHLGVRNYSQLLQEIGRLLRPGGLVLLVEPDLEPMIIQDGDIFKPTVTPPQQSNVPALTTEREDGSGSDSNTSARSTVFASPSASGPSSRWQQSILTSNPTPTATSQTFLTTNRQLNFILNPHPQTPVPHVNRASHSQPGGFHATSLPPSQPPNPRIGVNEGDRHTDVHAAFDNTASGSSRDVGLASPFPLIGSPRPITGRVESSSSRLGNPQLPPKMQNWSKLWSTFRFFLEQSVSSASQACAHSAGGGNQSRAVNMGVPRQLSQLLAGTELYENIVLRQANVPVGFWPSDPHLLTVGQLQWMDYELLLPAMRPFFLTKCGTTPSPPSQSRFPTSIKHTDLPSTPGEVDKLIRDAQHDLYYPTAQLFARIHVVYASKRLDLDDMEVE